MARNFSFFYSWNRYIMFFTDVNNCLVQFLKIFILIAVRAEWRDLTPAVAK
jgi:hypothetical protein